MITQTRLPLVTIIAATILLLYNNGMVSVTATSDGAGSCLATTADKTNFKNAHGEALNPGVTGDSSIQFSASKFVAGCMYTISICGPSYNGFLLAARDMYTDAPVGQFSDPSVTNPGTKLHTCGYLGSAVTHSMATPKTALHFKWRAPVDGADTHFYLTTVRSNMADWYSISAMFEVDASTTTCPSVPDSNTCPGAGESDGPVTEHDHSSSMDMHMQMSMKFSTAWSGLNIVFPNWVLNTKTAYVATVIAMFIICVLYEFGETMSARLDRYFTMKNSTPVIRKNIQPLATTIANNGAVSPSSPSTTIQIPSDVTTLVLNRGFTNGQHLLRTLIKVVLQFLALFLMIVFMILDVGICCAIMAGYGVGFYIFGRDRKGTTDCH